ncbi:hypothetical protein F0562_007931 [Nyssa sinensis]|uniref:Uncharacterized protein n=1 Tax=Nyssa sinensis TaxID=561372 RepID=A0A5J5A6S5_9ASTE|nr:hypothetical protein F0562_007931 [Nyssa sinensis]
MYCCMDLRYVVPPIIHLIFKLLHFQMKPWVHYDDLWKTDQLSIGNIAFLLLIIIATLLFLLIYIKLPLHITIDSIHLQAGDFSGPLAISLLCLIFLPQPYFWTAFPIIICISPWFNSLLNLLQHFLYSFYLTLEVIPNLNIICFTQQEENLETEPAQVEVEVVQIEGYPLPEQPDMLKRSLQRIPTFIIVCTTQQQETITEPAGSAHQSGVELNEVDDHYHPSNQQPTWEPEGTYYHSGIELNEVDDYYLLNEQPTSEHEYLSGGSKELLTAQVTFRFNFTFKITVLGFRFNFLLILFLLALRLGDYVCWLSRYDFVCVRRWVSTGNLQRRDWEFFFPSSEDLKPSIRALKLQLASEYIFGSEIRYKSIEFGVINFSIYVTFSRV